MKIVKVDKKLTKALSNKQNWDDWKIADIQKKCQKVFTTKAKF